MTGTLCVSWSRPHVGRGEATSGTIPRRTARSGASPRARNASDPRSKVLGTHVKAREKARPYLSNDDQVRDFLGIRAREDVMPSTPAAHSLPGNPLRLSHCPLTDVRAEADGVLLEGVLPCFQELGAGHWPRVTFHPQDSSQERGWGSVASCAGSTNPQGFQWQLLVETQSDFQRTPWQSYCQPAPATPPPVTTRRWCEIQHLAE